MTAVITRASDAEARREAQRRRCKADLLKRPCPKCGGKRLWRGPTLEKGKITCMDCGATFRKKTR